MSNLIDNREDWLNRFIDGARPVFEAHGYPIPYNLRVGMGLPPTGYRSALVGFLFTPDQSADGHWEAFINPTIAEGDARIAGVLTRLLCHAAVGTKACRGPFKVLARAVGLTGPLRDTGEGPDWFAWANPLLADLGPMDFAALSGARPVKKQPTWGIKVECPDCGWLARVSAKHIRPHAYLSCPAPDCDGLMISDLETDAE